MTQGLEELRPGITFLGGTGTNTSCGACRRWGCLGLGRPAAVLHKAADFSHSTEVPSESYPSNFDVRSHGVALCVGAKCAASRRAGSRVALKGSRLSDAAPDGRGKGKTVLSASVRAG